MRKLLSLIVTALALGACSNGGSELPESPRDAQEQGRADAQAFCDANYTTERDIHAALLAVKSREWQLRQNGDSLAANAYINAFRAQLSESDKAMASRVL